MKKIINQPEQVVEQMLEGLTKAHPKLVKRIPDTRVIVRTDQSAGKVGLVSGGGSGHEPAHAGYVGTGMLSAAVCGDVFTSPTPDQIYEGIKAADQGKGVLLIVKNYTGDVMNFKMAKDLALADGISIEQIIVDDDIAVKDSDFTIGRRGVAGTILIHKIVGAAAENGANLSELKTLGEKIIKNIRTLGVALSPCTVPEVGHPGFKLSDDEIELGIGIHGESGFSREKLLPSSELAKQLFEKINTELSLKENDDVVLLVNGMGATPLMEQYIFTNDMHQLFKNLSINVQKTLVGNFMTSLEMAGISLTVLKLAEMPWLDMLNLEVTTIAWSF
ncbi:dihydroxyacetone kinase subunit DhaK [Listeria sp. PSOL-1]|uniref:dihydroxyacetone kinase subunit DhaK n=1 Tax=Listeria sp. PSOL-1 TaxID=1844999 RepID=UPI0013CF64E1|nr:dihydroxyacetone kinase subunit DhaK [Listeria sp. PSOL-1]